MTLPSPRSVRALVADALGEAGVPDEALLLAAVSGGQDSVCLLHTLAAASASGSRQLIVVHVDHRLRGSESSADAVFVDGVARQLGLRCVTVGVDTANYARQHRLGLEEAGRNLRYQALAAVAEAEGAWAVVTGHTADDLAETLLINMVRGTGPIGATGLTPLSSLPLATFGPAGVRVAASASVNALRLRIVRPQLRLKRSDTAQYCALEGLSFRTDVSNLDVRLLRNRIRHHLLPLLRTYNPNIVETLGRLARVTGDDETALAEIVESLWPSTARAQEYEVAFAWSDWSTHSAAIQRRLLRRSIAELGGPVPSFRTLESARMLLVAQRARRQLPLGGDIRLETSGAGFRLLRATLASGESGGHR